MGLFKLNKYIALFTAILIVIANVVIDHFFAPSGILLMPLAIIISTALLNLNREKFHPVLQTIVTFCLGLLTDLGIKLYGGGIHDSEGLGFMNFFFLVGVIPGFLIFVFSSPKNKSSNLNLPLFSIALLLLLIILQITFLWDLGLGRSYPIEHNGTL